MIYLDNASTTKVNIDIGNSIIKAMKDYGNPSNIYSLGKKSKDLIEEAREKIAKAIGAEKEEIYFTSGASESNNLALNQRKYCWCSPYEHHSILKNPKAEVHDNIEELLISLQECYNDYKYLQNLYNNLLVSHMLVNNETGEIFNIKSILNLCNKMSILSHTDATQAIGKIPVNVKDLGVDMLSLSGHKFHCPKGIGAIYINKNVSPIKSLIYGGHQEHGVRAGTENVPYIVGLGYGIEMASEKMQKFHNYSQELKDIFLSTLNHSGINYVLNSPENSIPSIINISFKGIEGEVLGAMLADKEIFVGTGSACTTGDFEPSHVLKAMNVSDDYINGSLRISMGYYNTPQDMVTTANEIVNCYLKLNG